MHMLSITSIALVAFSSTLVSAGPINGARDSHKTCGSHKPFTGEVGCTPCKSIDNTVCGIFQNVTTDLICSAEFGSQWVPVNNPKACGKAASTECKSGKPFTGQAGCSQCGTEGNIVCGQDEDRTTDLICTSFGNTLSWVPVDDPAKCGVFTAPLPSNVPAEGCASGKPFQDKSSCETCATVGNVICGQDADRQTDLKCTTVGHSNVWIPVDTPSKVCYA